MIVRNARYIEVDNIIYRTFGTTETTKFRFPRRVLLCWPSCKTSKFDILFLVWKREKYSITVHYCSYRRINH